MEAEKDVLLLRPLGADRPMDHEQAKVVLVQNPLQLIDEVIEDGVDLLLARAVGRRA